MCDQLLPDVRLPFGWAKNVKSAVLHGISVAQFALSYTRGLRGPAKCRAIRRGTRWATTQTPDTSFGWM